MNKHWAHHLCEERLNILIGHLEKADVHGGESQNFNAPVMTASRTRVFQDAQLHPQLFLPQPTALLTTYAQAEWSDIVSKEFPTLLLWKSPQALV